MATSKKAVVSAVASAVESFEKEVGAFVKEVNETRAIVATQAEKIRMIVVHSLTVPVADAARILENGRAGFKTANGKEAGETDKFKTQFQFAKKITENRDLTVTVESMRRQTKADKDAGKEKGSRTATVHHLMTTPETMTNAKGEPTGSANVPVDKMYRAILAQEKAQAIAKIIADMTPEQRKAWETEQAQIAAEKEAQERADKLALLLDELTSNYTWHEVADSLKAKGQDMTKIESAIVAAILN